MIMHFPLLSGLGLRVLTSQPGVCMLGPIPHVYAIIYFNQIIRFKASPGTVIELTAIIDFKFL